MYENINDSFNCAVWNASLNFQFDLEPFKTLYDQHEKSSEDVKF